MSWPTPTYTPPGGVAPHPYLSPFRLESILSHVVRFRCCSQRASSVSTGISSSRFPPPWEGPNLINQPHPDPALLTTEPPSADNIADDAAKLNIVSPDFKSHPATTTSVKDIPSDAAPPSTPSKRRRYLDEVEQEGSYLFNVAKQYLFHPAIAGGLLGLSAYFSYVV